MGKHRVLVIVCFTLLVVFSTSTTALAKSPEEEIGIHLKDRMKGLFGKGGWWLDENCDIENSDVLVAIKQLDELDLPDPPKLTGIKFNECSIEGFYEIWHNLHITDEHLRARVCKGSWTLYKWVDLLIELEKSDWPMPKNLGPPPAVPGKSATIDEFGKYIDETGTWFSELAKSVSASTDPCPFPKETCRALVNFNTEVSGKIDDIFFYKVIKKRLDGYAEHLSKKMELPDCPPEKPKRKPVTTYGGERGPGKKTKTQGKLIKGPYRYVVVKDPLGQKRLTREWLKSFQPPYQGNDFILANEKIIYPAREDPFPFEEGPGGPIIRSPRWTFKTGANHHLGSEIKVGQDNFEPFGNNRTTPDASLEFRPGTYNGLTPLFSIFGGGFSDLTDRKGDSSRPGFLADISGNNSSLTPITVALARKLSLDFFRLGGLAGLEGRYNGVDITTGLLFAYGYYNYLLTEQVSGGGPFFSHILDLKMRTLFFGPKFGLGTSSVYNGVILFGHLWFAPGYLHYKFDADQRGTALPFATVKDEVNQFAVKGGVNAGVSVPIANLFSFILGAHCTLDSAEPNIKYPSSGGTKIRPTTETAVEVGGHIGFTF